MPKTIVVIGATGNQGGSVARTFLQLPAGADSWHVRAVTRSPSSPAAASLAAAGASLVRASLDDPASLRAAFAGAHAIFAVTDPLAIIASGGDAPEDPEEVMAWAGGAETRQLRNVADAAAEVDGLERLVLSTLQDAERWSGGRYKAVHHFTGKARAEAYVREAHPALWARTSTYLPGWFLRGVLPGGPGAPQKAEDGTLLFAPGIESDTRVPVFAPEEDAGPLVLALVREPAGGKRVLGQRASMRFSEFLALFAATTGQKTGYVAWPTDEEQLPMPVFLRRPLVEMCAFWDEFGYVGGDESVTLPEDLTYPPVFETVAQYLEKHDWNY
ncbi:NAD(P)-binding domain protein [Cordyceps fumosorosea ARSEF 2679]|uniref:NAD(P)-binding domain protein n=1 Tax=Cordyceps fumosorosea (strain ARSEF 2679) TaxID=1081104 RepID=A0A162MG26_CORFA|nr:NAD(P)-binding domain protein [Cordyceps fumosorosea ARSEF 2679]OAA55640.1 NAD(P)-binding domain protein [Cordyceps fumosorosea ARSEF 2679]